MKRNLFSIKALGLHTFNPAWNGFEPVRKTAVSNEEVAAAAVSELEASYSRIDWQETAKALLVKDNSQEAG